MIEKKIVFKKDVEMFIIFSIFFFKKASFDGENAKNCSKDSIFTRYPIITLSLYKLQLFFAIFTLKLFFLKR